MNNSLNRTLSILNAYINEDAFLEEFTSCIIKRENYKLRKTAKYYLLLSSINWFVQKVLKYELYFEEFYSKSEKLNDFEELEHHIHAYLEDVATVKNKLAEYLGSLKNDIIPIIKAGDKNKMKEMFDLLEKKMHRSFQEVLDLRRQHRHHGLPFIDENILNAELSAIALSNNLIKDHLNDMGVEFFIKQRVESFEKAKTFWIENARINSLLISETADNIHDTTKDILFSFLCIDAQEINKLISSNGAD